MIKSFKMLGRRWRLLFVSRLGEEGKGDMGNCDPPDTKEKAVRIRSDLRGIALLDTLIHEAGGHAADWSRDEAHIEEWATDLAKLLWALGYRRQGE